MVLPKLILRLNKLNSLPPVDFMWSKASLRELKTFPNGFL